MQHDLGIETKVVGSDEIRRRCPPLAVDDGDVAAYEPGSGYADPSAAAAAASALTEVPR